MSNIQELKVARNELTPKMDELIDAAEALARWHDTDRSRRDGSDRQDKLHADIESDAKGRVWHAKQAVEGQLTLVSRLAASID